tara:strand:+ start:76 stop:1002 length:927 start_codon:yes stop_codon:yes gene_type:complete
MTTIRIAGAQIPVSDNNIERNKHEIIRALDWAKENEVDHLLTPEGSLSGYGNLFLRYGDTLQLALKEVEDYQKKLGIGLHLGTAIQNVEDKGIFNRNQIRHYSRDGILCGQTNKTYLVPGDKYFVPSTVGSEPAATFPIVNLKKRDSKDFTAVGMICNDMWGGEKFLGVDDIAPKLSLTQILSQMEIDLVFHSTNGYKFDKKIINEKPSYQTLFDWHDVHLRYTANLLSTTILTVESCVPWNWDGNESIFDKVITPSSSGVIGPFGNWLSDVPRSGRQYFYHDLDIDFREDALKEDNEINQQLLKRII